MSDTDLKLHAHKIRGHTDAWWYEDPKGIAVVVEFRDEDGTHQESKIILIPWNMLRPALERKDAP